MLIDYKSPSVRFTGRFAELNNTMTATAAGSAIEISFKGDSILLKFDLTDQVYPYPHLWMQLDGGAWIEAQLDWYLRMNASNAVALALIHSLCKKVEIKPNLGNLSWAKGTHPTPYGIISVECKRLENGEIHTKWTALEEIEVISEKYGKNIIRKIGEVI